MSYIQIRIDDELKEEAVKLFNELGLDLSTAIRLFLKKSIDDKKMPFKFKKGVFETPFGLIMLWGIKNCGCQSKCVHTFCSAAF